MYKKMRILGFLVLLLAFFSGTAAAYEANYKDVWVTDNGGTKNYRTALETVNDLFAKEGYVLEDKDLVNVDPSDPLERNMKIVIDRGFDVTVKTRTDERTERVSPGTFVGSVIHQYAEMDGVDYVYGGEWNEIVYADMVIRLEDQSTETIVTKEILPFVTEYIETENLPEGSEELVTEGKHGEKEITTLIAYENGREVSRKVTGEKIVQEPVNSVIHVGIGRPLGALTVVDALDYIQELVMEATAYTAGPESTGKRPGHPLYGITASGREVEHGIVSVDPDVIPLGTELYVEGYGYCIAADTGSAIKGNKIDLYYDSKESALQFGRQQIKVYVLKSE